MTTPQKDQDILAQMRAGVEYEFPIRCRNFVFKARPLSISEQNKVLTEAQDKIDAKAGLPNVLSESAIIAQTYLIYAARPYGSQDITQVNEYLLNRATPEELQYLYSQYCAIVDKCNPALEFLSSVEVQELVEQVKKKKNLDSALIDLSFKELASICRHLLQPQEN